jgi:hypothetical protein
VTTMRSLWFPVIFLRDHLGGGCPTTHESSPGNPAGKRATQVKEGLLRAARVSVDPKSGDDPVPTMATPEPSVAALLLCNSHWFGPSAYGLIRESAAVCAIRNPSSGASVHGWGFQFGVLLNFLSACERIFIH